MTTSEVLDIARDYAKKAFPKESPIDYTFRNIAREAFAAGYEQARREFVTPAPPVVKIERKA